MDATERLLVIQALIALEGKGENASALKHTLEKIRLVTFKPEGFFEDNYSEFSAAFDVVKVPLDKN